jgi:hypothetical protein
MNRGMATGDAAAKNKDISSYLILLPIIGRIRPWHNLRVIGGSHYGFLLADETADKQTSGKSALHWHYSPIPFSIGKQKNRQ